MMMKKAVSGLLASAAFVPAFAFAQQAQAPLTSQQAAAMQEGQRAAYGAAHDTVIERKNQSIIRPDEVNKFRQKALDNQAAMANPAYDPDAEPPEAKRKDVDYVMEAGRDPELLSLSKWAPTPITFLDRNKKAIPVRSLAWNRQAFSINGIGCPAAHAPGQSSQGDDGAGGDQDKQQEVQEPTVLYVVPCRPSQWGGIAVQLKGYPVPVEFIISASPKASHIDTPVVLNVHSPAPPPRRVVKRPPPPPPSDDGSGPSELWSFMSGTPPQGAVALPVRGPGQAWRYNGNVYVKAAGRMAGIGQAGAEATTGQQSVYRFDGAAPNDVHFMSPTGQDETLSIGVVKRK
ncbi:DotH/IcmK family type IV secretion protein [Acetobacter malorum]|nr:DotH/IcmK family type IV secretion protein [Acetobacter malorum]KXV08703.1 hypothetical protein AD930_03570 [Acetobacter malorum]